MDNSACMLVILTATCVSLCESAHNRAGTLYETDIFSECVLHSTSSKGVVVVTLQKWIWWSNKCGKNWQLSSPDTV